MPLRTLLPWLFAILVGLGGVFLIDALLGSPAPALRQTKSTSSLLATTTVLSGLASTSSHPTATTTPIHPSATQATVAPTGTEETASAAIPQSRSGGAANQAARIQNPYPNPPEPAVQVNADARSALVNILCLSQGSIRPISGSGVIIDPRGVILTNAHVAQYVLLSESPNINLSCEIRSGSPARNAWKASVLYLPPVWVEAHANEINSQHPTGTGEHDYALLLIDGSSANAPLPSQLSGGFPFVPVDTRNGIGFVGDQVLVATYPAEFIGGIQTELDLYAASSITTVGQLLTFGQNTVDAISLGGIIEAQAGSSGGEVVNPWGRLIGVVTTTTDASTTAGRDLRAITLSYINTDLKNQSGSDLSTFLTGDVTDEEAQFNANVAPSLLSQYFSQLEGTQN